MNPDDGGRMIDFYTWSTPNGRKVSIMLEECGLPYRAHAINIGQGEQFKPEFVAINPNSKIPAIVDPDGPDGRPISLMESGAILIYLAGKTGKFLPQAVRGRYDALQWLMFQMGGVGPMFGQACSTSSSSAMSGWPPANTPLPTWRPIPGLPATSGTRPTSRIFPASNAGST